MPGRWDDDALIAALRRAVRARQAVPPEFVAAGKSAYAWHNIDAELARLTYDSVRDAGAVAAVRAEDASIRALTFRSANLAIELEVTGDSVLGQVVSAQAQSVRIQLRTGAESQVAVDEIGCFSIRPIPAVPFQLQVHTADGLDVRTGWVSL
jgi:hypothetical protein